MSNLYIIATPIGNLEDITFRAIKILKSVDFIIAEDTRHAQILLKKYDIKKIPLESFHAKSSEKKLDNVCQKIYENNSAAYISDAGTPCISDPGFRLIKKCVENKIKIIPIPGPSALTTLLSVSGIPVDRFKFLGFLPHKKGRQKILQSFIDAEVAQVFFESVYRFEKMLNELEKYCGKNRQIIIGRELTKIYEEIFRGTIEDAKKYFTKNKIKGEFVVIVGTEKMMK